MLPDRAETKAILSPLGANWGSLSGRFEAMSCTGALLLAGEDGPGTLQILESNTPRSYTNRPLLRETEIAKAFSGATDSRSGFPPDIGIVQSCPDDTPDE